MHQTQEAIKSSITDYYSIENELAFVRSISYLPQEERMRYVRENVIGFLGEFAGQIPYKRISYRMNERGLEFAGIPVMDTYRRSATIAGPGSREWFETNGIQHVESSLMNGNNSVTLLSPPKTADYGFVFHFYMNDNHEVNEYILRYGEKQGSLKTTEKIARNIDQWKDIHDSYQTAEDYLSKAFIGYATDEQQEIRRILRASGISEGEIRRSEQFEKAVKNELDELINRYVFLVDGYAKSEFDSEQEQLHISKLLQYLTAMFNRARELKIQLEKGEVQNSYYTDLRILALSGDKYAQNRLGEITDEMIRMYGNKPVSIEGRGSCPVTTSPTTGFIDSFTIKAALSPSFGVTPHELFQKGDRILCCTCPFCKEQVEAHIKEGKIECPKCHKTANWKDK